VNFVLRTRNSTQMLERSGSLRLLLNGLECTMVCRAFIAVLDSKKGLKLCTLTLLLKDILSQGIDRMPCDVGELSSQNVQVTGSAVSLYAIW
jgi:hypothetical protein